MFLKASLGFHISFLNAPVSILGLPHWLSGKESASTVGAAGAACSIPGSGRSPGGGMATHFSILAWRIPWTEEPGRLSPQGHKELDITEAT